MSPLAVRPRMAFSLLEVIIATAILAGSAMVLFSLIGMGTKYGNKAEQRTLALTQAESLLDEFIARMPNEELRDEVTGVLPSTPTHSFRIEATPYEWSTKGDATGSSNPKGMATDETSGGLYRVTLELFESSTALAGAEGEPLCQLTQLVRRVAAAPTFANGGSSEGSSSINGRSPEGPSGTPLR